MELLIAFKDFKFEMSGVCCEITYKDVLVFEKCGKLFSLIF